MGAKRSAEKAEEMAPNPTLVRNKVCGDLGALSLFEICQFLLIGQKTGTLKVEHRGKRATLTFADGQIIAAVDENLRDGQEAVYRVLRWGEGSFEFTPGPVAGGGMSRIGESTDALLLESARRLDEAADTTAPSGGSAGHAGAPGPRAAAFLEKQRLATELTDLFASLEANREEEIDFRQEVPLEALLALGDRHGATQIHLRAGETPKGRGPRGLFTLGRSPVTTRAIDRILVQFLGGAEKVLFDLRERISREALVEGIGYVHLEASRDEELRRVVITRLQSLPPPLAAFDVPEERLLSLLRAETGILLVASAARGGKSAIAAAIAAEAARGAGRHIVLFEETRRYRLREESGVVEQRDLVPGGTRLDEILNEVWRAKAQVIVLDAVRCAEHAEAVVAAAEAGALVIATVDSPGAAEAIARFPRFVEPFGRTAFGERVAAYLLGAIAVRPCAADERAPHRAPRAPHFAPWQSEFLPWSPHLAHALRTGDLSALAACLDDPGALRFAS